MKRFSLLLQVLSLLIVIPVSGQATLYSAIHVFGDSLSDNGNVRLALLGGGIDALTPVPVSGNGFIPDLPYDRGAGLLPALSNGPNWIEDLSTSLLGAPVAPSLAGGSNHAFGGARMAASDASAVPSVAEQVSGFLAAQTQPLDPDALYVVWGGGNDVRDAAALTLGGGDPSSILAAYADALQGAVGSLLAAGADYLLVPNIPDIGMTPAIRQYGDAAAAAVSLLTAGFNDLYNDVLDALQLVHSEARIIRLDTYRLLDQVVASPASFGLSDADNACAASVDCIADPDGHFFWDGIHPTAAGHALIAAAALRAVPEPSVPLLLLIGLGVLFRVRRPRMA